jgi:hypothetical protein
MDAWEYFYSNGSPVGRAQVGTMMYDARPSHQHWHFEQFAGYTLLDANRQTIARSRKTGFCLAPTDAIDLTAPNALWNPYSIGLSTACGGEGALWVREALPVGWGDTYYQSMAGQSFDITDLPNGTYYIQITANPAGLLMEASTTNNTQIRRIVLGGRPGHRSVKVPAWHGIDPEPGTSGSTSGSTGGGPIGGGRSRHRCRELARRTLERQSCIDDMCHLRGAMSASASAGPHPPRGYGTTGPGCSRSGPRTSHARSTSSWRRKSV